MSSFMIYFMLLAICAAVENLIIEIYDINLSKNWDNDNTGMMVILNGFYYFCIICFNSILYQEDKLISVVFFFYFSFATVYRLMMKERLVSSQFFPIDICKKIVIWWMNL